MFLQEYRYAYFFTLLYYTKGVCPTHELRIEIKNIKGGHYHDKHSNLHRWFF